MVYVVFFKHIYNKTYVDGAIVFIYLEILCLKFFAYEYLIICRLYEKL
jgi:hypothetical protein